MRLLIISLGALLLTSPAFASSDLLVTFCKTQPDPRACIRDLNESQWKAQWEAAQDAQARADERYAEMLERQAQLQLEQARIQANGLALLGAGNAMIHGMNQGFQNMRQPYVNTPAFSYPTPQR